MKNVLMMLFCLATANAFAQNTAWPLSSGQVKSGAESQLGALLNKAAMVQPASASPLGKNWFRLEADSHIFTDEVSVKQVAGVFFDLENHGKIFNGKKSNLTASVVSRGEAETIVDFVSTTYAALGIKIKAPYRAFVRVIENNDSKVYVEIEQVKADSASNDRTKNLYATRYAQSVTIGGREYTYIRISSINDANGSILPGAKDAIENHAGPANLEALYMIIEAAKGR